MAGLSEGGGRAGNVRLSPPCAPCPGPGARLPSCWVGARDGLRVGTAMAPAASRLRVESELGSLPRRALAQYLLFLKLYPVLTKAVSRWARTGKRSGKEGCRQGRRYAGEGKRRGASRPSSSDTTHAVVLSLEVGNPLKVELSFHRGRTSEILYIRYLRYDS